MEKTKKAGIARALRALAKRAEDFVIPPLCIICDKTLDGNGRWFCKGCMDLLAANHAGRDACPQCTRNRRRHECACEFAWDFPFQKIVSVYDYDDTLSSIARHIKYKGKSKLAYQMGIISSPSIPDDFWAGADIVIPVPLHRARMRKRGYNQAEFFARGVLKARPLALRTDILTRTRNTGTQTQLDREGRLENLIGAFAVNPSSIGDINSKHIILVDDILTTGATTEACAEELLKAGCASVKVLSLGRD